EYLVSLPSLQQPQTAQTLQSISIGDFHARWLASWTARLDLWHYAVDAHQARRLGSLQEAPRGIWRHGSRSLWALSDVHLLSSRCDPRSCRQQGEAVSPISTPHGGASTVEWQQPFDYRRG